MNNLFPTHFMASKPDPPKKGFEIRKQIRFLHLPHQQLQPIQVPYLQYMYYGNRQIQNTKYNATRCHNPTWYSFSFFKNQIHQLYVFFFVEFSATTVWNQTVTIFQFTTTYLVGMSNQVVHYESIEEILSVWPDMDYGWHMMSLAG